MPARKKFVAADVIRDVLVKLEGQDTEVQQRVLDSISAGLGLAPTTHAGSSGAGSGGGGNAGGSGGAGGGGGGNLGTIRSFLREKKPQKPIEIVACLAYYQTYARNEPRFKPAALQTLYHDAAYGEPMGRWADAVGNAQKAKYLAVAGAHGVKQLGQFGEDVVEALPDQSKVLALKAGRRQVGGRRRKKAGRKKARS